MIDNNYIHYISFNKYINYIYYIKNYMTCCK